MPASRPSKAAEHAALRAKIGSAPVEFLIDVMNGVPIPKRDEAGRVVGFEDKPELGQRIAAANALAKKILPDLAQSKVELEGNVDHGFRLVLQQGVAPPGSEGKVIDHTPAPTLEHKKASPASEVSSFPDDAVEATAEEKKGPLNLKSSSATNTVSSDGSFSPSSRRKKTRKAGGDDDAPSPAHKTKKRKKKTSEGISRSRSQKAKAGGDIATASPATNNPEPDDKPSTYVPNRRRRRARGEQV